MYGSLRKDRHLTFDMLTLHGMSAEYLFLHLAYSFTGGDTGIAISKKAGMVPLQMELGGKDACIVCDDADLDLAAANIVKGGFSYRYNKMVCGFLGCLCNFGNPLKSYYLITKICKRISLVSWEVQWPAVYSSESGFSDGICSRHFSREGGCKCEDSNSWCS